MLHALGNGPGKLVLFGPPDNVVSLLGVILSSILPLAVVGAVLEATLQLLLTLPAHEEADEAGAYGPWLRFESRCGVFDALS